MYRRDLRDTSKDSLLADMATVDAAVQAVPEPDGERIVYAKNREGQLDLWLLEGDADVRLTSEGVQAMRYGRGDPQFFDWAPDGGRIAYLTADATLATVDVRTGEKTELTGHDAPDLGLAWSPDGAEIALVTDRFSRASLAVVSADGTGIEALADDEYLYGDPRWSDDGDVYVVRSAHRDLFDFETELARVDRDGAVEAIVSESEVRVRSPRPRPRSDDVAFVSDESGFDAVYRVTPGDDPVEVFAVDEAEAADPAWDDAGERLALTVTRNGRSQVYVVENGDARQVTEGPGIRTAPRWLDGDVVAVADEPRRPPVVRNVSTDERLSLASFVGFEERLVEPEELFYESEGREVHAVVYPPAPDAEPGSVPLLVKAHGGPTSFDSFGWDYRAQYFAALGYVVVCPNYRGSDGFGRAFRNLNDREWGGGDLADVVNAADAVAGAYEAVDGDRAGIFGGSGGGLMTVNALGNTDRFRAGAAFYGVYDYETFVDDTDDIGWQLMKRELGDLSTDLPNYREASPIRRAEDIEDPLLVLHGEADARVPISQSEQLVEELEKHGKRHELRRYEDEPHGFGARENVVDAYTRVADLFAKYLAVDPDDGSSRPYEPPA